MRFPIQLQADMVVHLWRNHDNPRTPLVLMLEPLHACDLRCADSIKSTVRTITWNLR